MSFTLFKVSVGPLDLNYGAAAVVSADHFSRLPSSIGQDGTLSPCRERFNSARERHFLAGSLSGMTAHFEGAYGGSIPSPASNVPV
jgi:hypothetical protein